jgi:hypothetical protein
MLFLQFLIFFSGKPSKLILILYSKIGGIFGIDKSTVHKAFTEFTEVKTVNDLSADRG